MKSISLLIAGMVFSTWALAADAAKEKPTQHLKVADVESMAVAKEVFIDTTAQIRRKKTVGPAEASEIHIITYSLEKSVAYFADNLSGEKQTLAQEMAVVVEEIHLASENNRLGELENHLSKYADLVDKFLFDF
ncbi:MAG: DUF6746 family protein [Burkholderiaceae bacterium]